LAERYPAADPRASLSWSPAIMVKLR